jgi:type IV pilus assembly protein PilM
VGLFSSSEHNYVGLDLGASHIKLIALKNNSVKRPKLIAASIAEVPPGAISDGAVTNIGAVKKAVTEAFEQTKVKLRNQKISIGLRGINVLYKRLIVPHLEPEEMHEQCLREAQQQIDSDLEDWVVDYQVVTEKDDQGQVVLMLVAGRRGVIQDLQKLIMDLGGHPVIVDCDAFAVPNAQELAFGPNEEPTLYVDIGKESTKVYLAGKGGIPSVVRSFALGGMHLTELIAKSMAMDLNRAEALKISASQTGSLFRDERLASATKSHMQEIITELVQTLEFYAGAEAMDTASSIKHIVLSGGAATTAGLAQAISQHFKAKTEYLNPFRMIEFAGGARLPESIQPHVFATSVGLALRFLGDKPS